MKKTVSLILAVLMIASALLAFASCGGKTIHVIETGSETGTYYGFTNMIATKLNEKADLGYTL
ncbi:MAG: hypothetical protein J6D16_01675, partial [Clostridia bacterium]|nr:hypothetical protein [Clostridia bacterium]